MIPDTPLNRRILRIVVTVAFVIAVPVMLVLFFGMIGIFFTILFGLLAIFLVLAGAILLSIKIFGVERVQRFLARFGIEMELDETSASTRRRRDDRPRDANGDVIEDAVILEDTPPGR